MSALLLLASQLLGLSAAAAGDPPEVRYVVKVVTKSWTPLELPEVERMLEAKAMSELTRAGAMRSTRSGYADLKSADYALQLDGRFIEEAESFSVYITFGPGKKTDLPSFHVSESAAIGGLARSEMQKRIEKLAESAGKRMAAVLAPELEAVRLSVERGPLDNPVLPWSWGPIDVPRPLSPSKAQSQLLEVRNEDHVRHQGLAAISGQAFDQQAARNAIELCVLRDPSPELRVACVRALAPVARAAVPTQRVLLQALRNDVDDQVVSAILEVAQGFVGLSRKECIESWLEMVASDATPAQAAGRAAELLAKEGDVPNLDLAVAKCLQQESLVYGKRQACADQLLRVIPPARKRAVVLPYLQRVEVHAQADSQVFEPVVRDLTHGMKKLDPQLAELFLGIATRPRSDRARREALVQLRENPAPTPESIQRLLSIAGEGAMAVEVFRTIEESVQDAPDLIPMTLGALKRLRETAHYFPRPHTENPLEALDKTIKRLEKRKPG